MNGAESQAAFYDFSHLFPFLYTKATNADCGGKLIQKESFSFSPHFLLTSTERETGGKKDLSLFLSFPFLSYPFPSPISDN